MIKIRIIKDNRDFIWQFTIKGHAGYSKSGSDVVCAAISAIAYTTVGALIDQVGFKEDEITYIKDGYMLCTIPYMKMNNMSNRKKMVSKVIMRTAQIGFMQVEMQYGKYVKVVEENCN